MTPDSSASDDEPTIGDRMDRLEEIAETLETGEIDLDTAKELRIEADEHLSALRDELDVDGETADIELADPEPSK